MFSPIFLYTLSPSPLFPIISCIFYSIILWMSLFLSLNVPFISISFSLKFSIASIRIIMRKMNFYYNNCLVQHIKRRLTSDWLARINIALSLISHLFISRAEKIMCVYNLIDPFQQSLIPNQFYYNIFLFLDYINLSFPRFPSLPNISLLNSFSFFLLLSFQILPLIPHQSLTNLYQFFQVQVSLISNILGCKNLFQTPIY